MHGSSRIASSLHQATSYWNPTTDANIPAKRRSRMRSRGFHPECGRNRSVCPHHPNPGCLLRLCPVDRVPVRNGDIERPMTAAYYGALDWACFRNGCAQGMVVPSWLRWLRASVQGGDIVGPLKSGRRAPAEQRVDGHPHPSGKANGVIYSSRSTRLYQKTASFFSSP